MAAIRKTLSDSNYGWSSLPRPGVTLLLYRVVPFIVSIFLKTLKLLHFVMKLSEVLTSHL